MGSEIDQKIRSLPKSAPLDLEILAQEESVTTRLYFQHRVLNQRDILIQNEVLYQIMKREFGIQLFCQAKT